MLSNIISLVSGCITFLGGFVVVWGAVSLGLAIKDETRGGAQIAGAISTIAGAAFDAGSTDSNPFYALAGLHLFAALFLCAHINKFAGRNGAVTGGRRQ